MGTSGMSNLSSSIVLLITEIGDGKKGVKEAKKKLTISGQKKRQDNYRNIKRSNK